MAADRIEGGCACGAIRYSGAGDILFAALCQCRDCQRTSGGGHAAFFILDRQKTEMTGEPTFWETIGQSGNEVERGFCSTCGSPVFNNNAGYPDNIFVHAATLDDPARFQPQRVLYRESAVAWDHVDPALDQGGGS